MRILLPALSLSLFLACGDSFQPSDTMVTTATTPGTSSTSASSAGSTEGESEGGSGSSSDSPTSTTSTSTTTTTTTTTTSTTDATTSTTDATTSTTDTTTSTTSTTSTTGGDGVDPPLGGSSKGQGGGPASGDLKMAGAIEYRLIVPAGPSPQPLMIVYSGVEGGQVMTNNLLSVADFTGTGDFIFAVLDGKVYYGNGAAGATVLDDVRSKYDIDNDRTYLLSESAGTSAGLQLGLSLRQSYFAAYWANDVNASATPAMDAATLGFQPWGNAGPGGQFAHANTIVDGMTAAGYRIEEPAPYDGPGADQHGNTMQFLAALQWFPGRSRQ